MRQGDYYEVVLRQTFSAPFSDSPSELLRRIQHASPSPYEFLLQLGDEQLVGASPEMFVRVEGQRVETCPIARHGSPEAAIRCATPKRFANCSTRPRKSRN